MTPLRPLLFSLLLFLAGCAHAPPIENLCYAIVENVEDVSGQHYTVADGPKPLSCLHLRVVQANNRPVAEHLRLFVAGLYSAAAHGGPGEMVAFRLTRPLSSAKDLNFDQVSAYRVLPPPPQYR